MVDVPLPLRTAIESGRCVLFVGAGIGTEAADPQGRPAPTGEQLAKELAEHFQIEGATGTPLSKVAQVVELRKGRQELQAFLAARLANLTPNDKARWLFSLPWKAIFTTNYDHLIERAYELNPNPPQTPVSISSTAEIVPFDPRFQVPIYHLHGPLFGTSNARVLITEDDYARFREKRRMLFELLKVEFAVSTILYVGYSNDDPNWKMVLDELTQEFLPKAPPASYRLAPSTDPLDCEILRARGVITIDASISAFVESAALTLAAVSVDTLPLQAVQRHVPLALQAAFERSPAAVARLLNSWTDVNEAPFHEAPNIREFLSGELPNWGLVGGKLQFERDIEDPIFDELLDYATNSKIHRPVYLVVAPAGYGTSTVLMSMAARLVSERCGPVFMLRTGAKPLEGDVSFACSMFPGERPFFVVDNAADAASSIGQTLQALRDSAVSACFLLGERLNQWRQGRQVRLRPKEFGIEPLSEGEIDRLLEYLKANNALNQLAPLDIELQRAAIRSKHEKQLLVAMKEATEGKGFDAIIEDEYRRLPDDFSRHAYAAVCCGYHLRRPVRDRVLAAVLEVSIEELYEKTKLTTEGVISYDCLDENRGYYAARARHQVIAEIVWRRCIQPGDRGTLTTALLKSLNLAVYCDVKLFEESVRSDDHVDNIPGLEGKIRFFEEACRKAPDDPYVLQHYARMLAREDQLQASRAQIERALAMSPTLRVLHHTKGTVLRYLALKAENSLDIARKFLAQSEAAFGEAKNLGRRDPYAYQGLAELYLGWASRAPTDEERIDYIAKAEAIVGEGLREVDSSSREGLWICSADVHKALGNIPKKIELLNRAVVSSPGGTVARYLLGRAYRDANRLGDALAVLKPVVENYPNEYRACILYAVVQHENGESWQTCIATLRLAELHGMQDARYIATLGGMLFMNGDFSAAEKIFAESAKGGFSFEELNREEFVPKLREIEWTGTITDVRHGFAFVQVAGYPAIFFPGAKFGRLPITKGIKITFRPAFRARGVVVRGPRLAS